MTRFQKKTLLEFPYPSYVDTYFKENAKKLINISLYDYKTKGWSGIGEGHDSCTS